MEIKDNIYTYRKALGLTQKELAEKIGVKAQTIQKYESGQIDISVTMVKKIATALCVDPIDILGMRDTIVNDNKIAELMVKMGSLSDAEIDSLKIIVDSMNNNRRKRP